MDPVVVGLFALAAVYAASVYAVMRTYRPGTGSTRGVSALHIVLGLTFIAMAVVIWLVTRPN